MIGSDVLFEIIHNSKYVYSAFGFSFSTFFLLWLCAVEKFYAVFNLRAILQNDTVETEFHDLRLCCDL